MSHMQGRRPCLDETTQKNAGHACLRDGTSDRQEETFHFLKFLKPVTQTILQKDIKIAVSRNLSINIFDMCI